MRTVDVCLNHYRTGDELYVYQGWINGGNICLLGASLD